MFRCTFKEVYGCKTVEGKPVKLSENVVDKIQTKVKMIISRLKYLGWKEE